jgi:hypothetical protein
MYGDVAIQSTGFGLAAMQEFYSPITFRINKQYSLTVSKDEIAELRNFLTTLEWLLFDSIAPL